MCGALSEKSGPQTELAFARDLLNAVVDGFPHERVAMHMCRENWTTDESKAITGDYRPLVDTLAALNVLGQIMRLFPDVIAFDHLAFPLGPRLMATRPIATVPIALTAAQQEGLPNRLHRQPLTDLGRSAFPE